MKFFRSFIASNIYFLRYSVKYILYPNAFVKFFMHHKKHFKVRQCVILKCAATVFMLPYGYKTWTKPVRVAAVGNAENTTSDVHDIADVRYCFVFYASFEISYVPTRMTNSKR